MNVGKQQPSVAVIGVGRSGTSATAGLLVQLGLTPPRPDDLIEAGSSNERGHWESKHVHLCNVRLLRALGCTTYGPPPVTASWNDLPNYPAVKASAREWFEATSGGGSVVVKDPRMCLTLPFWRDAIPAPMAAIFILRDPVKVARSYVARDGIPMSLGLALWDRYTRSALVGLAGMPTLVAEYDTMLADPRRGTAEIVEFLEQRGVEMKPEAVDAASDWFDVSLRHQEDREDEYSEMAKVQREIFEQLCALSGGHEVWQATGELPPPPLWVDDMIQLRRDMSVVNRPGKPAPPSSAKRIASAVRGAVSRP